MWGKVEFLSKRSFLDQGYLGTNQDSSTRQQPCSLPRKRTTEVNLDSSKRQQPFNLPRKHFFRLSTTRLRVARMLVPRSASFSASFHFLLVNCVPLFASTFLGFPIFFMKSSSFLIVASHVALLKGYYFVYLVNVSTITSMYSYPYLVFVRGPKKSMDIISSGSSGSTDSWMSIDAVVEILFR